MSLENTDSNQQLPDQQIAGGVEKQVPEKTQARKKKKRKFSWFRFFGRLFLVFGVLLGITYLMAYFYFNAYLRKEIIRLASSKTDSLYALQIDYIGVNLFTSSIQVKNAHFYKNPSKWNTFKQQFPDTNYLDIDAQMERFRVTGISWLHFLKTREIKIKKIIFQKPQIKFKGNKKHNKDQQRPPPKPVQALTKIIGKIADNLTIEQISIEEGEVGFYNQTPKGQAYHQVEKFTTEINHIRLTAQEQLSDSQALKVQDFAFRAKKYVFNTPDQVYTISLKQFKLDSKDSTLQSAGIKVKPHFTEKNRLNNLKSHKATFINANLDSLTANRIDFFRLISKKEIDLGGLFIHHLQLEVSRDKRMPQQIRQKKQNLKQVLAKIPLYIRADTLALKNATIKYVQKLPRQRGNHIVAHQADSIHLYLCQVALGKAIDSATKDKLLYSESVDLAMRNYRHHTPDGLYRIALDKAWLSSRKSLVQIQNASLQPLASRQTFTLRKFYQSVMVDAKVKTLHFTNLDIEKLVYNQEFIMRGLYINQPRFKAYTDKRRPKRPTQKYQNFEEMLQSLPLHIEVDTFAIKNASLEYVEQQAKKTSIGNGLATHKAQNMNIMVQRIQLGKALTGSALAELDTKSLLLNVKNYHFKTPDGIYELRFNDLEVSSAKSAIEIDSLMLHPLLSDSAFVRNTKYRKPLLNIALSDLKAQEVNFDKLLLYQEFDWGKLYLNRPAIDIFVDKRKPKKPKEIDILESAVVEPEDTTNLRAVLRNLPLYIKVDTFAINNATLRYREQVAASGQEKSGINIHQAKRLDCMIPHIRLGKASKDDSVLYDFYSPHIVLKLDDYKFQEKNNVYQFSLKNIHSSFTDAQILIEDIKFKPLMSPLNFSKRLTYRKPLWNIQLKSISAHQIDLEKLVFDKQVNLQALHLNKPDIRLYIDKLKPKNPQRTPKTIHEILRDIPIPIHIDTFLIYNGNFRLTEVNKKGKGEHMAENINVIAQKLTLEENKVNRHRSKDLLFMDEIFVNLSQYHYTTPDQLYQISLYNMASALSDSSLQVHHLSLKPRISEKGFDSIRQYRALRIDAELTDFNAQHIDFRRLFDGKGIAMKELLLNDLHIDFYQNNNLLKNPHLPSKTLQQQLAQIPVSIAIDSLHLGNSFVNLRLIKGNRVLHHQADSVSMIVCNFKLDSMAKSNPARQKTLFADDVRFSLKNYRTQTPNKVYGITTQSIIGSTQTSRLLLKNIEFKPLLSEEAFKRYYKVQEDRFKLKINSIGFNQLQFDPLIRQGKIKIGSVNVNRFMMDIFRDRREPPNPRKIIMPNEHFRKIPFSLKVDTLKVSNSFVMYGEKVKGGIGFGQVFFTQINARATNIDSKAPETNLTTIKANTRLMGRGFLETTVNVPLLAPAFECNYSGQMGEMEAKFFNTMITANDHIFIKRGRIRKVKFKVNVKDSMATGELLAGYRKLKIQVLRKKNHQRKRGLLTFIANLIIKHTNNLTKKRYKKGQIKYKFRKNKEYQNGFVGLLWRALSTGLVDTIK